MTTQQNHAEEKRKKAACTFMRFLKKLNARASSASAIGMTHNGEQFSYPGFPKTHGAAELDALATHQEQEQEGAGAGA
jgi:hypothetical protein